MYYIIVIITSTQVKVWPYQKQRVKFEPPISSLKKWRDFFWNEFRQWRHVWWRHQIRIIFKTKKI